MSQDHAHSTGYKQYFVTWLWLLVMTALALGVGYVHSIPETLKAFLLVGITLAKIVLIGSIFMHLKSERMNLVMLTFTPLILSVILFFFTYGEMRPDPTHELHNQSPVKAEAAHPAGEH